MNNTMEIGKWLQFDAGTCFGTKCMHFGFILGIDYEQRVAVVAVNATSQIEKLIRFADLNNIPIEDAMVGVTNEVHFNKPTGVDCHRAKEVPLDQLDYWMLCNKVRKPSRGEDVRNEIMQRAIEIVLRSPLVPNSMKNIVRNSNN